MRCHCGATTQVLQSRIVANVVRRRRRCTNDHRFTTFETGLSDDALLELAARADRAMLEIKQVLDEVTLRKRQAVRRRG